jgi:hypothetical protein
MNGAFLHLVVNHISVVGLPFCFLMLAARRAWQSKKDFFAEIFAK